VVYTLLSFYRKNKNPSKNLKIFKENPESAGSWHRNPIG
jgi:hypothetical protein